MPTEFGRDRATNGDRRCSVGCCGLNPSPAWEEIADVRTHRWSNRLYTAEFFAAGGCSLDQRVVDALGQLDAARVLHLMCSTGEESLSLAVLGARVLAVDISER